jgi:class 3 adenylate cyclase
MAATAVARAVSRRFSALIAIGDRADDREEAKLAHHYLVSMGVLMACGGVVWGSIYLYYGLRFPSLVPFAYVVLTICNFSYFRLSKHFHSVRFFQVLISLLLPFVLQWSLGGFVASGAVMLWGLVALLGSLVFHDLKSSLPWLGAYLLLTIFSGLIDRSTRRFAIEAPPGVTTAIFVVNIAIVSALAFGLNVYLLAKREDARTRLAEMASVLKQMFGRYLSTEVMNSLVENPSALELGGRRTTVTIMMTDLRGFTALAERLQPEQVVQMLNAYFEIMIELVLKYQGTINEIVGDALLVIFGAPQEMPDRVQRAIACAIEMQNAMTDVNARTRLHGLPPLEMGIALNDAEVIVGNIGSAKRSKYAVVGGGVNMTSRIESYTVGGQILISESVRRAAGEVLRIDGQSEVLAKGADTAMTIYEVGAIAGAYSVALSTKAAAMVPVAHEIPLHYRLLEGKNVGGKGLECSALALSRHGAHVRFGAPVELMANVRLNLNGVDEALASKDLYGKITRHVDEQGEVYLVTFTSVPAELDAYFQAHLQFANSTLHGSAPVTDE